MYAKVALREVDVVQKRPQRMSRRKRAAAAKAELDRVRMLQSAIIEGKTEAKNSLERYCSTVRETLGKEKQRETLESGDKEILEEALHEVLAWMDKNELAEQEEFQAKEKELESLVSRITMSANKAKIEARNDLEKYCARMRKLLAYKNTSDKLDGGDKEKIRKAAKEAQDWLDKNQLAEKGDFEGKKRELAVVMTPIILKVNKDRIEAEGRLQTYCATLRNTLVHEQLKKGDQETLEKALSEVLVWLEKSQFAEKYEFDAKQKKLEGVVNPILTQATTWQYRMGRITQNLPKPRQYRWRL